MSDDATKEQENTKNKEQHGKSAESSDILDMLDRIAKNVGLKNHDGTKITMLRNQAFFNSGMSISIIKKMPISLMIAMSKVSHDKVPSDFIPDNTKDMMLDSLGEYEGRLKTEEIINMIKHADAQDVSDGTTRVGFTIVDMSVKSKYDNVGDTIFNFNNYTPTQVLFGQVATPTVRLQTLAVLLDEMDEDLIKATFQYMLEKKNARKMRNAITFASEIPTTTSEKIGDISDKDDVASVLNCTMDDLPSDFKETLMNDPELKNMIEKLKEKKDTSIDLRPSFEEFKTPKDKE